MTTNTMKAKGSTSEAMANCLNKSEVQAFLKHREHAFYLWVVFHELLGHGTGKLLVEKQSGGFNFDAKNPPVSPVTGNPIDSWYKPGQTWTGLFGDIATTVDECRAECVGAYLLSDMELLAMFGYTNETEITGRDCEYLSSWKVAQAEILQWNTICTCSSALRDFVLWRIITLKIMYAPLNPPQSSANTSRNGARHTAG